MDENTKSLLRFPEQAAFQKYYDDLLLDVSDPVRLAELLLSEGMIGSETKECITADEDEDHAKRTLFDALQYVLMHGADGEKAIRSLRIAFEKASFGTYHIRKIEEFIAGECTISLRLA